MFPDPLTTKHEGNAILGIFLATYSSKGDYLPLRYPLSQFDYEYAESVLKAAEAEEARKRGAVRPEKTSASDNSALAGSAGAIHSAAPGETSSSLAKGNAIEPSQSSSTRLPASGKTVPSRNTSYASVTNASTNTPASTAAGQPNSAAFAGAQNSVSSSSGLSASQHKADGRAESKPSAEVVQPPIAKDNGHAFPDSALMVEMNKGADQRLYMAQDTLGFDTKFLAQLFSPRPSMSDRRFQVAIGRVLFVGHPLRDDPKEKARDPDYYDAEQDDAETMLRLAPIAELDGWKVRSDIMMSRGSNQQGTKLLADLGLVDLMLNREPSETGDSAISEGERAVRDSKEWKRRGYRKRVYPKLFHIVFMLDNTYPNIELIADRIYEHVLKRLTKALMIEQMETNYVLTQSRLVRTINDQALSGSYTSALYLQEVMRRSTLATNLIELYNGLRKGERVSLHVNKRIMLSLQIPRGPKLGRPLPAAKPRPFLNTGYSIIGYSSTTPANASAVASATHTPRPATPVESSTASSVPAIAQATQSIAPAVENYCGPAFFLDEAYCPGIKQSSGSNSGYLSSTLNELSLSHLQPVSSERRITYTSQSYVVTDSELQPGEYSRYPRIEPFHAILLLDDAEVLQRRLLYSDASPTLLTLIDAALPTRPLSMLHAIVDCSFAQLCRFAAHLVYWNVARLICPIKMAYAYVPTAKQLSRDLISKFSSKSFQLCTLPQLFAAMHPPRPATQVFEFLTETTKLSGAVGSESYGSNRNSGEEMRTAKSPGYRTEFQDMLVFLLREGAIAQYHTWPVVLVPNYVKFDLSEEQFMRLSIAWFRSLHIEHPDLLGAYPQALLDRAEFECWHNDEAREQADMELVEHVSREAEHKAMLCRVMRKLALRRVRDLREEEKRGKQGKELRLVEQKMAEEEDKIHVFCNRIEKERMDSWIIAKSQYDSALGRARLERVQSRRAQGKDIPDGAAMGPNKDVQLYKWYNFIKNDPDLGELTREIMQKYVSFVPAHGLTQRTEAEKRYMYNLVQDKPAGLQDWFIRHSHLFTGKNHLIKLLESEQASVTRLESMLREFDGIILLLQHT